MNHTSDARIEIVAVHRGERRTIAAFDIPERGFRERFFNRKAWRSRLRGVGSIVERAVDNWDRLVAIKRGQGRSIFHLPAEE